MDTVQIKGHFLRLRELDEQHSEAAEKESGNLLCNLVEHFLLEQKRQTELLEQIANTADFFERQRREGMG